MSRDRELEKQIDAYVKGHLNEEQAEELWAELFKNPEYIELLNTELGVRSILTESTDQESPATEDHYELIHSLQNSWKWVAVAASIVILVVAINFFRMDAGPTLQELSLNEITLSENLASAPTLRSEEIQVTPGDSLLNMGFKAAISGDIDEAIELYDAIIVDYPDEPAAVQAYLNKGIIHFNRSNFDKAIASFKEVTETAEEKSFTREKGYWYLGNAYINTDSLEQAHEAISEVYAMEGIYHNPAGDILHKLDEQLGNPEREYNQ